MTVEELKEFLNDESNKVVFEEIVKSMGYETKDGVEGLVNKKNELLIKLKKAKEELVETKKQYEDIDLDEYNDLKSGEKKKPDIDSIKLKRQLDEKEKELKKYQNIESDYNNILIESSLKKALKEVKVDPLHEQLITSAFKGKAKVEIDDDKRNVVIDDDGLGLPPTEYFKKWIETETGKAYLAKPDNKGSNSKPFGGDVQKITREEFDKLGSSEKMSLIDKGTQII